MLKRNKRIITSMALAMIITSTIATTTKALVKDKIQNDSIGCETALKLAKEDRDINSFIKINEVKANDELKCNDIKKAENMIKQIEARNIDVLKRILEMNSRITKVDNICGYKPICKPTCIKPVKPTVVKPGKEVKPTVVKPVEEVKPTVIKPIVKPVKPVEEIKPTVVKPSVIKPVEEIKSIIKPEVIVNKEVIEEIKTSEKVKINNITNDQEQNQLVKTGNVIDTSLLIKIAGVLSVAGAFLVNKFRK